MQFAHRSRLADSLGAAPGGDLLAPASPPTILDLHVRGTSPASRPEWPGMLLCPHKSAFPGSQGSSRNQSQRPELLGPVHSRSAGAPFQAAAFPFLSGSDCVTSTAYLYRPQYSGASSMPSSALLFSESALRSPQQPASVCVSLRRTMAS